MGCWCALAANPRLLPHKLWLSLVTHACGAPTLFEPGTKTDSTGKPGASEVTSIVQKRRANPGLGDVLSSLQQCPPGAAPGGAHRRERTGPHHASESMRSG